MQALYQTLSGASYAEKHLQATQNAGCCKAFGHRVVACIEYIPLVGAVAALIEKCAAAIFSFLFLRETPMDIESGKEATPQKKPPRIKKKARQVITVGSPTAALPPTRAEIAEQAPQKIPPHFEKMWKNAKKAIEEHKGEGYVQYSPEVLPDIEQMLTPSSSSLAPAHTMDEKQGVRLEMEDAHFYLETDDHILAGVFDGHGGSAQPLALYLAEQFSDRFLTTLAGSENDFHHAFTQCFSLLQKEIEGRGEWNYQGATAVVSCIEKKTQLVYTATLGDSEANLYRNIDGEYRSIPLSCVRDWSCPKDAKRAAQIMNDPSIAEEWPKSPNPKTLRIRDRYCGLNVSRALGDVRRGQPDVVSHKPKITVNRVKAGDFMIWACDGIKDYIEEKVLCQIVTFNHDREGFAQMLTKYALKNCKSQDNVTVVALHV